MPSARLRNTQARLFAPHKAVAKKGIRGKSSHQSLMFLKTLQSMQPDRVRVGGVTDLRMYEKVRDCVGKMCSRSQYGGVSGERARVGGGAMPCVGLGGGLIVRPSSNRAIGFGDPLTVCESFLLDCRSFRTRIAALYGSCARETFGSAGTRSRFANLRTAVTHSFGDDR
jgi:hypothetical protein